jgi:peptide/nickel transport system substrate-binding protein
VPSLRGSLLRLVTVVMLLAVVTAAGQAAPASAGSATSDSTSKSGPKKTLSTDWRLAFNDAIDYQSNVFASYDSTPYFIFTEVYDTLLNYDIKTGAPDLKNSPAYKYTVSPDGLTITYYLRSGLRWSDGKPMTADDVVFSYEAASHSNVNSDYTTNMKSIKALSPTVVQLKLRRYDARILSAYVPIVPKHIWGKVGFSKLTKFNPCCPMVGSGPFYVKSLDPQGTSVLLPNPYFYGPRGHIKRILLIRYQDEEAMLRDLKLGRVDAINSGRPAWVDSLGTHAKLWASPGPGFNELAFNMCPPQGSPICTGPAPGVAVKVVQDPAIRHAVQWAIDRKTIDQVVWHNLAPPGDGIISPWYASRGYYKDWSKDPTLGYHYDPARARQVLKDGGWVCPSAGTCTKDGVEARFTVDVLSDTQEDQETALRIKAWLKAVGIDMNIQVATEDAINAQIYHSTSSNSPADKGKYEPTYDAFMWSWGGDLTTPDYNFEVMTCSNTSADAQWCNPEFSKLTADALHERNFLKRVDMLHEAEKLELEASPYIVYAYTPYISVTRTDTWTGYTPSPQPGGQPFGMNWLQLQLIVPGDEISSSYAGTGYVITFMVVITLLVVAVSRWQRWREEREPFERGSEQAEPSNPEPALP